MVGCTHVQLFTTLCVFSMIVPSYMIHIKHPHKLLCMVQTLHETGCGTWVLGREVVSSIAIGIALPKLDWLIHKPLQLLHFLPCNAGELSYNIYIYIIYIYIYIYNSHLNGHSIQIYVADKCCCFIIIINT